LSPAAGTSGLTPSTEDYLKAIYRLGLEGAPAQTSAIAEALGIAPPSVSGMVKRLSESGLVEHVKYHGVTLTRSGHRAAIRIIRRHRVLETYLATKLGYDWDSVHEEAERLEHAASDELIERMAMALGNPQYHPHGAPIPTKDGAMETPDCVPLTDIAVGELVELRMVSDKNPERLRYLSSLDLKPGISFVVLSRQAFCGPINIRLAGSSSQEHVIGFELARSLFCDVLGNEAG
jgi:DtxR family Mn-dependent transcriptional regulator